MKEWIRIYLWWWKNTQVCNAWMWPLYLMLLSNKKKQSDTLNLGEWMALWCNWVFWFFFFFCCAPWHVGSLFPNWDPTKAPCIKHKVLTAGLPVTSSLLLFFEVTVAEACAHLSVLRDMAGFKNSAWILPDCSRWFFWVWTEQHPGFISKRCLTQHKGKAHLLNADSGRSVGRSRGGGVHRAPS